MRPLRQVLAAFLFTACLLSLTLGSVLATHTSGYRSGNLGQCYRQGYIYSKASNIVEHSSSGSYVWWNNSTNTYRSNYVATPTWWAVDWDHSMTSAGATCTAG